MQQLSIRISALLCAQAGIATILLVYISQDVQKALPALVVVGLVAIASIIYIFSMMQPMGQLVQQLELMGRGQLGGGDLEEGGTEIGRAAQAVNQLRRHLQQIRDNIERLARGDLEVNDVEKKVLSSNRLADAKMPTGTTNSDIEKSLIRLDNQMKQLTIQARLLSQDRLSHPVIDERIPGALGDAFYATLVYLRDLIQYAVSLSDGAAIVDDKNNSGDLKQTLNVAASGTQRVLGEIKAMTLHMSTSTEEMLAVLHEQTLSASHQASGVEETQRTMETLLSSAKRIAESAQTVFKSAERTQANNRLISDRANELKSHTERISEILETIKTIADRSDLLALNASLEGLRAGEAGKGFTLVAAEMRRLAENIKDSIKDVKGLLSDIRASALSNVMAVEEGSRLSQRTTESALKISLITQQQQSGTEQVTQSMEELSHLINQGLVGTNQVTTAASELASLAEDMRTIMGDAPVVVTTQPSRARLTRVKRTSIPLGRTDKSTEIVLPTGHRPHMPKSTGIAVPSLKVNRAQTFNPELNATMRFVMGDVDEERTLDMSQYSSPKKESDAYDEMDNLFEQINQNTSIKTRHKTKVDESIEETFDAIERQIDDKEDQNDD